MRAMTLSPALCRQLRCGLILIGLGCTALPAAAVLNCTVASSPPLVFGAYNALLFTPLDAQTSINLRCTGSGIALMQVRLRAGLRGSVSARSMQRGAASLSYGLYTDSARSSAWGDGTSGTNIGLALAFPGSNSTLQVYGRIPPRQNVPTGAYSDTVTVQVDW
jgi:spore coat protein U-like protein